MEEPRPEPTFHEFSSEWYATNKVEWRENTQLDYEWQLTQHLLPFFARHKLSAITVEEVDRYRAAKVREGRLGARSINKTITRLAQILEVAVEYGYIERKPARGTRRRRKADAPRRHFLEADQLRALLDAAGRHRTLLATAIMAGGLRGSRGRGPALARRRPGGREAPRRGVQDRGGCPGGRSLAAPSGGAHGPQGGLALLAAGGLRVPDREGHAEGPQQH